ncbi:DUF234 domain-containing protein [Sulfurovum sp.]|uniref:DUF234 domain-containing protein n=1 Tax=Sulfurovum sp. TaxID=1969726 RepID=UPI0025F31890|nr:DUF234 domain-containing protein [Sulfurovum sp.]
MEENIELDYFENVFEMVKSNFVDNYSKFQMLVSPSYLLETPYREVLMAVARGDGKFYSVLRKAKLSEGVGEEIIRELISLGILWLEPSRESPLRVHPKHKLKKELRSYRIQDKLRFVQPFMRFWFGFVTYYKNELLQGEGRAFLENFQNNYERLRTLVYEQLCDALLVKYYENSTPLLSHGSYWDQYSEFDILAITNNKKLILGECKYKERKVCKNELTKLKSKALQSGIKVDVYALFSKSGFSNELLGMEDENLLLFDLDDLKVLL